MPTPVPTALTTTTVGASILAAKGPQALELARTLPVPQVLVEFRTTNSGGRAELLSLLPVERVAAVLLQDERVFMVPASRIERLREPGDHSQGFVTDVSAAEADHLREAGLGTWLVTTRWDDSGEEARPIAWGLLRFVGQFSGPDALERLDAILEGDNDDAWKLGALRAMPESYWALALVATSEIDQEGGPEARLKRISDIDEELEAVICSLTESYTAQELHVRVLEAREEQLPQLRAEGATALTDTSLEALQGMGERRSARDLLADLRGGPKKT